MISLSEADDAARFGGKAAGLARAISHGLPVPRGFALEHALVEAAVHDAATLAALAASIISALPGPLALRSSAVGEDGHDASFAGQHATKLNTMGAAAIARALKDIWSSARSASALAYRMRLGLPMEAKMAIVAQELVRADVAGVLFTRNPATGAEERVIEAARGLGDAVVQGLVTPEQVRLALDGRVIEQRAGHQDLEIAPSESGGTEERVIEPGTTLLLDRRAIARLAELAARAESHFEGALDLEWAFAADVLFLLQARRVTR